MGPSPTVDSRVHICRPAQLSEARVTMGSSWHELLRPLCADALVAAGSDTPVEIVLFFVARWCQKETGVCEPNVATIDQGHLADVSARVVRNLDDDGARVD